MTTTTTFSGVDPSGRSSSRVLRPPGGASNFSLGFGEQPDQPARKYKMASNIFGPPDDLPAPKPGKKESVSSDAEPSVPQRRPLPGGECGDSIEQTGDSEEYGKCIVLMIIVAFEM
ncbi:hypothetical protein NDU88_008403 [Pleurodeles waltl]|uniref:Uncharacterized protein n=1 Tax=Pleurodeles waltl TaxID=8319 RepID=A0AAV7PP24_PLEWA|nr:hypothetical protein NDU88_008403 [Pleurodeles waltl]